MGHPIFRQEWGKKKRRKKGVYLLRKSTKWGRVRHCRTLGTYTLAGDLEEKSKKGERK